MFLRAVVGENWLNVGLYNSCVFVCLFVSLYTLRYYGYKWGLDLAHDEAHKAHQGLTSRYKFTEILLNNQDDFIVHLGIRTPPKQSTDFSLYIYSVPTNPLQNV